MESIIEKKSFDFAVRIVNLYRHLTTDKKEFVLSKQLLSSTMCRRKRLKKPYGLFPVLTLRKSQNRRFRECWIIWTKTK